MENCYLIFDVFFRDDFAIAKWKMGPIFFICLNIDLEVKS
jgi:hypothetical protein